MTDPVVPEWLLSVANQHRKAFRDQGENMYERAFREIETAHNRIKELQTENAQLKELLRNIAAKLVEYYKNS